jgi:hypothetical protein
MSGGNVVEQAHSRLEDDVRTPRAAAVAGIAFSVLLIVVFALLDFSTPGAERSADWYTESSHRGAIRATLVLMPIVGIAFLWFIGVIRSLLGEREDKLFATVFLGSGLLFVAMLFIATALTGGLVASVTGDRPISSDLVRLASGINAVLIGTLAIKMAAIFTLSVSNLGRRTDLLPRWLVWWGLATGLVLLLSPIRSIWVAILFPIWVLTFSTRILVASFRPTSPNTGVGAGTDRRDGGTDIGC